MRHFTISPGLFVTGKGRKVTARARMVATPDLQGMRLGRLATITAAPSAAHAQKERIHVV